MFVAGQSELGIEWELKTNETWNAYNMHMYFPISLVKKSIKNYIILQTYANRIYRTE